MHVGLNVLTAIFYVRHVIERADLRHALVHAFNIVVTPSVSNLFYELAVPRAFSMYNLLSLGHTWVAI